jgi:hypothetical protein
MGPDVYACIGVAGGKGEKSGDKGVIRNRVIYTPVSLRLKINCIHARGQAHSRNWHLMMSSSRSCKSNAVA